MSLTNFKLSFSGTSESCAPVVQKPMVDYILGVSSPSDWHSKVRHSGYLSAFFRTALPNRSSVHILVRIGKFPFSLTPTRKFRCEFLLFWGKSLHRMDWQGRLSLRSDFCRNYTYSVPRWIAEVWLLMPNYRVPAGYLVGVI